MHYSLLYISRVVKPVNAQTLNAIREEAIECNQTSGLTGLLLWTREHFCQILQGQKTAVEDTMQRIERDSRHIDPIVLLRTDLAEELFPDWSMASSHVEDPAMAVQIGLAYQDRLADLRLVDGIIALMQKFQRNSNYSIPPVDTRSSFEQQLVTLAARDNSDIAIEQVLQLGRALFSDCALVLLLRGPGKGEWYAKKHVGINGSKLYQIVEKLALEHSVTGCVHRADGVITKEIHSVSLASSTGFKSALGCAIGISTQARIQSTTAHVESHGPLDNVGSVWILFESTPEILLPSATRSEIGRLAVCLEKLLEQKVQTHTHQLLKQQSIRQQLSLAASNRRQEMVMNVASSAMVAVDRECRVLIINEAARKMFGGITNRVPFHWPQSIVFRTPLSLEPLPQSACPVYLAATDNTDALAEFDTTELSPNIFGLQICDTEPLRYLRITSSTITEIESAISGVVVFEDVTELQHNRERIRRSDRLEALGHLTGGIAHDFNNLLSIVQSSVELAITESNKDARQSFLDITLDSVKRGADLTNKLVAFAVARRVGDRVYPIKDVMQSVADLVAASIEQDINFILDEGPESLAVYCDGGQLENALLNILINSRDAILESGVGDQVSLVVTSVAVDGQEPSSTPFSPDIDRDRKVRIVVTDNGPGMTSEVIRKAADPFFTTRVGGAGSGLGLSMVYRFIEQSGGELLIENLSDLVDNATGVRVSLLLDQALTRPGTIEAIVSEPPAALQDHATVLLVEDETSLAEMLRQSLNRYGLDARVADSADQALETLQSNNDIDLLLTDIVMPGSGFDGYALAAEAVCLRPELKVVYLSGYPQQSGKSLPTTYGPLIKKPVSMEVLAEVIRKELARGIRYNTELEVVPG